MPTLDAAAAAAPEQMRHRILRIRQETRRRTLVVSKVERVTPAMARITFTSPDLADFASAGHDDHVKLFFPGATAADEQVKRDYTPRRFDAANRSLVIDFVLHDGGPATGWAKTAAIGDVLEIGGPRGSAIVTDDFDWYLLVGDESALPAIGRRIEELRPGVHVTAVIVVENASEVQDFVTAADLHAIWVKRRTEGADDAASLLRALERLGVPKGDGFVWIAAEAGVAKTLRRHVLEVRGHPPAWVKAAGYWIRGRDGAHVSFNEEE